MNKWLKRLLPVVLVALAVVLGLATPAQGKEVYVAVQSGNDNAVIFDKPSLFGGEIVAFLSTNDELEVLDDKNKTFYQVKTKDGTIGWVARNIVRDEKVGSGDASSSGGTGGSSKGLAAMGFSAEIEGGLAEQDENFRKNLETVRELETTVRGQLSGVWREPKGSDTFTADERKQITTGKRKAYSEFANAGGLEGSNP